MWYTLYMNKNQSSGLKELRCAGEVYALYCDCPRCPVKNRVYVGQTTRGTEYRLRAHRDASKRPGSREYTSLKSQWIREHGRENIQAETLESNPATGLDSAEAKWIALLETRYPQGLNMRGGGHGGASRAGEENPGAHLTEEQVVTIINRIGTDVSCTSRSLAGEYDVTKTLILKIDQGALWSHLERPHGLRVLGQRNNRLETRPQLQAQIWERYTELGSFTRVSDDLGVSYGRVRGIVNRKLSHE